MSIWDDERVEQFVKTNWIDGKAGSEIVVGLWINFRIRTTRSAIIAYSHRRGWISPNSYKADPQKAMQKRKYKRAPWAPKEPAKATQRALKAESAAIDVPGVAPKFLGPKFPGKTILELGTRDCRYVLGESAHPALYCGAETQPDSSFCPYHHRLCWYPTIKIRSKI